MNLYLALESVVQASIVIITTAAGKLQDDSSTDSLDPAVSLWLAYAFVSVAISGALLLASYAAKTSLPAARLSQISPSALPAEVERLALVKGIANIGKEKEKERESRSTLEGDDVNQVKLQEKALKSPNSGESLFTKWVFTIASIAIIVLGWIMFGLGVGWGVHGSVVAGTVGE